MNCSNVCPKGLSPARAIGEIKKMVVERQICASDGPGASRIRLRPRSGQSRLDDLGAPGEAPVKLPLYPGGGEGGGGGASGGRNMAQTDLTRRTRPEACGRTAGFHQYPPRTGTESGGGEGVHEVEYTGGA